MISIQKTKNQEELDRRMAAPEEAEILQEVLELEKEKKVYKYLIGFLFSNHCKIFSIFFIFHS